MLASASLSPKALIPVLFVTSMLGGCRDNEGAIPSAVPSGASSASTKVTASASADPDAKAERASGKDELQPVYPRDNKPAEPAAERYCRAVHMVWADRHAACCKSKSQSLLFTECVRTLSFALRSGAITIADASLAQCEAKMKSQHEGCGWVGLRQPPLPTECLDVLQGTLEEKKLCRSSLECKGDLSCAALGAIDPGVCMKPRPKGASCGVGTEVLAATTNQGNIELKKRECEGWCSRRRCEDATALGQACNSVMQCGPGHACIGGKCSDKPLPAQGEACAPECQPNLICKDAKCTSRGLEGADCTSDAQCFGACDSGKCVQRCARANGAESPFKARDNTPPSQPSAAPSVAPPSAPSTKQSAPKPTAR